MRGMFGGVRTCKEILKVAILKHSHWRYLSSKETRSRFRCVIVTPIQEKGLENITVTEVLMTKGDETGGSWFCCRSDDVVDNCVKNMARHNIGSLVVMKPGEQQRNAGIFTERAYYLRKIFGQGNLPENTRVAEIMTAENKLITLPSDTNILQAKQFKTDNQIRHVPAIDGKIVGMISIVDVVRAAVDQHSGELKKIE